MYIPVLNLTLPGVRLQQEYFQTSDNNFCSAELIEYTSAVQGSTLSARVQPGKN